MFKLKISLQHILNPLHVYCRLAPLLGRSKTMALVRRYEGFYKRVL